MQVTTTPATSTPATYNTGMANTGNINTGAFISGNHSNGLLWRGDNQGLIDLAIGVDIPEIPIVSVDVNIPIHIPITASFTDIVYSGLDLPPNTAVTVIFSDPSISTPSPSQ